MSLNSLNDVFIEQLKDLQSAEKQLLQALPKMAKGTENEELRTAFEEHLEQTKGHFKRLEAIFERLDEKPGRKKCKAMEGLIKEGTEILHEDGEPGALDAALIAAAQRIEHYEIAGYGCARAFALQLGDKESAEVLKQTLDEEAETDKRLSELALGGINEEAVEPVEAGATS